MPELNFHFPIAPITKDNVKVMGKHGKFFLPRKHKSFEQAIRLMASAQMKAQGFINPILEKMTVTQLIFRFEKALMKKDFFNYTKSLFDALNKVVYKDDSQIIGFEGIGKKELSETPGIILGLQWEE